MPYKYETDKQPLPPGKDRRAKLTPEQREEIRENPEGLSKHQLAVKFGVSRRLVQFIQHPERHAKNLNDRQARGGWKQYYDKDKHAQTMREHRHYKQGTLNPKEG